MDPILREIIAKCSGLKILDTRNITDDSCEVIFSLNDREDLRAIFGEYFGKPEKPTGDTPSRYHEAITRKFGGIWFFQKLYVKKTPDLTILALFKPWRDGMYVTVKLGIIKSSEIKFGVPILLRTLKECFGAISRLLSIRTKK